jgi:hypothetical protein
MKRQKSIDVLHVHGFRVDMNWAIKCAGKLGIPVVYTEHSTLGDWLDEAQARVKLSQTEPALITGVSSSACDELSGLLGDRGPALLVRASYSVRMKRMPNAGTNRKIVPHEKIRITSTSHMRVEKESETIGDVNRIQVPCKRCTESGWHWR